MVMDFDDRLLHYALWFGGMLVASAGHRLLDALGWAPLAWAWKLITRRERRGPTAYGKALRKFQTRYRRGVKVSGGGAGESA